MPKCLFNSDMERAVMQLYVEVFILGTDSYRRAGKKYSKIADLMNEKGANQQWPKLNQNNIDAKIDALKRKGRRTYRSARKTFRSGPAREEDHDLEAAYADWPNFRLYHKLFFLNPVFGAGSGGSSAAESSSSSRSAAAAAAAAAAGGDAAITSSHGQSAAASTIAAGTQPALPTDSVVQDDVASTYMILSCASSSMSKLPTLLGPVVAVPRLAFSTTLDLPSTTLPRVTVAQSSSSLSGTTHTTETRCQQPAIILDDDQGVASANKETPVAGGSVPTASLEPQQQQQHQRQQQYVTSEEHRDREDRDFQWKMEMERQRFEDERERRRQRYEEERERQRREDADRREKERREYDERRVIERAKADLTLWQSNCKFNARLLTELFGSKSNTP